jgi:1,4-dihydroxy-2-naphthoyl-CoA hydrolase
MEVYHVGIMEPIPFAQLMGIEIVSVAPEKVIGRLTVRDEICTRPAVLHGGAAMAFADTLGAIATVANLPDGHWTTTIESKTNFISAAASGSVVTGECTPIHRGKRTMVWQTRITLPDGKLVALVTQTQMVLEPKVPSQKA